jgi:uncharacterized protein YhbP (UPF0306 family)
MTGQEHAERIKAEMRKVGVTSYGLKKYTTKMLIDFMDQNEHIGGVIYGRTGDKLIESESVMLVATDRRLIYLNHEPFSRYTDEIGYDVVAGVKKSTAGPFSTVTLLTRMIDTTYVIKYVNTNCARQFVKYIDLIRLREDKNEKKDEVPNDENIFDAKNENYSDAISYLQAHELAVFSTFDTRGVISGAVVYYSIDKNNNIYIVTKSHTKKAQNILTSGQVALTVFEPTGLQTVQLQGMASIEKNEEVQAQVFNKLVKNRYYSEKIDLPPVTKIKQGAYTIIKIVPQSIKFRDYSKS